ncbi:hypothetical protein CWE27_09580 [Streptomyces sp. EAG2]|nr:hypothetical protein CWE27_09580 [Streptomyces sp. EAG2]
MGAAGAAGAGRCGGGLRGQPAGDGGSGPVLPLCGRSPARTAAVLGGGRPFGGRGRGDLAYGRPGVSALARAGDGGRGDQRADRCGDARAALPGLR